MIEAEPKAQRNRDDEDDDRGRKDTGPPSFDQRQAEQDEKGKPSHQEDFRIGVGNALGDLRKQRQRFFGLGGNAH